MEIKTGDIFYSSWGYEQTNVNYYEVVKATEKTVWLRELKNIVKIDKSVYGGKALPAKGEYVGEVLKRKIKKYRNEIILTIESYKNAYFWDGKAKEFTSYC